MKKMLIVICAMLFCLSTMAYGANGISGLSVDPSTGEITTTFKLTGAVKVIEDADGHTLSGSDAYGALIVESGSDQTIVAPAAVAGMNFCVLATGATGSARVYVDCDAADKFRFYNLVGSNGETVHNITNATGDKMCFEAIDSSTWMVTPHGTTVVANQGISFIGYNDFMISTSGSGALLLFMGSAPINIDSVTEAEPTGSGAFSPTYVIGGDLSVVTALYSVSDVIVSSGFAGFSGVTELRIYQLNPFIPAFPLSALSTGLTSLLELELYSQFSLITGNLSSLAGLTTLTNLTIGSDGEAISGDLNVIANMTSLATLELSGTACDTYTTSTLPATLLYINAEDCTLASAEVDAFLCDLDTAGGLNGEIDISGTNAAPSATGLTCKTSLEGKGWDVTVTE